MNPFRKQNNRISVEEMNRILLEKVPLKERMDAVYIPIIAQDCACYLCEDVIRLLRELKMSCTRRSCRELDNCIKEYRDANRRSMSPNPELFEDLKKKSKTIYDWIGQDMHIHVIQYTQELYNRGINLGTDLTKVISEAYVVRKIIRYVLQLDRDFSVKISSHLPLGVKYQTKDNEYCVRMDKALTALFTEFKTPDPLDSVNIQISYQVFQNRLKQYHIGYEEKKLEGKEKEMYEKGYCRCEDCEWSSLIREGKCNKGQKVIDTPNKRKCWRKCSLFKALYGNGK